MWEWRGKIYASERAMKIAKTMAKKPRSHFWAHQQMHKPVYWELGRSYELAEVYGTMLGDGCMQKVSRTDKLTIAFNRKEQSHLAHVEHLLFELLGKKPTRVRSKQAHCDYLCIYQKYLQRRFGFPYGRKIDNAVRIPNWIMANEEASRFCLKGLFETDGDWVIDEKYGTNVIKFTNASETLLNDVFTLLAKLGYHPCRGQRRVYLARKREVYRFVDWIQFRLYDSFVRCGSIVQ